MKLIDRSPGAFIALANLVVYGVIGVEIWMWTVATAAAVTGTLVLIAVVAAIICRSTIRLMDDETTVAPPIAVPAPARLARRRPSLHRRHVAA